MLVFLQANNKLLKLCRDGILWRLAALCRCESACVVATHYVVARFCSPLLLAVFSP